MTGVHGRGGGVCREAERIERWGEEGEEGRGRREMVDETVAE